MEEMQTFWPIDAPERRIVYQGELLLEKQDPIKLDVSIRTTKERLYLEAST